MSIANAFAKTTKRRKRYTSLFPPDWTDENDDYNDYPLPGPIKLGNTRALTKSWRVIESNDSDGAFLSVEYYDETNTQWISVHSFNAVKSQ